MSDLGEPMTYAAGCDSPDGGTILSHYATSSNSGLKSRVFQDCSEIGRNFFPSNKPLVIDLFCGLGGWAEGFLAEGYTCIGFDIERHDHGTGGYPGQLVIQDVLTLHGSQFKDAAVIVASPPCQEYSYMAMPWSRAKKIAEEYRSGVRDVKNLTALFDVCFRLQIEASWAAQRYIPLIVENVRGAQPWVGRSRWHYGSFHLWGDVPALMPWTGIRRAVENGLKLPGNNGPSRWEDREVQRLCDATKGTGGRNLYRQGVGVTPRLTNPAEGGTKHGGDCFSDPSWPGKQGGVKQSGISGPRDNGKGDKWFQDGAAKHGSKSNSRKAASAQIAKIPFPLARHIAQCFKPVREEVSV